MTRFAWLNLGVAFQAFLQRFRSLVCYLQARAMVVFRLEGIPNATILNGQHDQYDHVAVRQECKNRIRGKKSYVCAWLQNYEHVNLPD